MARKLESDGVIGMLRRLFGHEEDRKLLHKFAQKYPLKAHRVNPKRGYVFKPSVECDNLIKNLVALDAVFNSQDFVCDLAMGKVDPKRIEAEIGHAKSRLEKKLRAYSYWANRLVALESLLKDKPSLETFALEDRLLADSGSLEGKEAPYALRAVQLLEKVEEQGRRSLLSASRLADKAWALHRLELYDQAEHSARQALDVDPAHSEAWMLLAILSIRERQSAQREVTYYQFQREEADPVSSHERWAEEVQDMAEAKVASALEKHRKIVFPALLYWPHDPTFPNQRYRYRESYERIRNWCIDWLFGLMQPQVRSLSSDACWSRHACEHEPLFDWKNDRQKHYERWAFGAGNAHCLSPQERQVAELICQEWDECAARRPHSSPDSAFFHDWWAPGTNRHLTKLKLVHVRFVLGLPGYDAARENFFRDLEEVALWEELSQILYQPAYLHAFTLHNAANGVSELMRRTNVLTNVVAKEHREKLSLLSGNLLRRAYHEAFIRADFEACLSVAKAAQTSLESGQAIQRPELGLPDHESNTLSLKCWKYLELRAAIEIVPDSAEAKQSLLSVDQPAIYFAKEANYLIHEAGDIDGFDDGGYVAPYGESIITSGRWLQVMRILVDQGAYAGLHKVIAERLVTDLSPLVEEHPFGGDSTNWLSLAKELDD